MDAFSLFPTVPYTFLELSSGVGGNKVVSQTEATGIFKGRDGMLQTVNSEAYTSQSTLHIRPDEPFIEAVGGSQSLVGHGIRVGAVDYRIEGVTVGTDFENGSNTFYKLTLKKEALWSSALPLE